MEAAAGALAQLQADLPSGVLGHVFSEVRSWVDAGDDTEGIGSGDTRRTRLTEALRAMPSLVPGDLRAGTLERHRRALSLAR